MNWIEELMNNYYSFLKENTVLSTSNSSEWVEISTPFTSSFNDTLDIYAKKDKNKIFLSDDGNTLRNLELYGMEIMRSQKRKQILDKILLNYDIKLLDKELVAEANEKNFPQKKLNIISAISEINDLYCLAKHTVSSVFREDVKSYLDDHEIIYTPHFISKGSTGLEFTFDFQIAYKKTEIVIKSFNSINKMNLPQFLFTWEDIKRVREKQTEKNIIGLAVINDIETEIKDEYINALDSCGAEYIRWSKKEDSESIQKLRDVA
ncbi:MAG: DUF1828 domain-containing protein [Sedimentisphaeraceae bacterium JB056]